MNTPTSKIIEKESGSKTEDQTNTYQLYQTITIFVALTVAGVLLIVLPQSAGQEIVRAVLPLIGTALFSAGLTYLLLEAARIQREASK